MKDREDLILNKSVMHTYECSKTAIDENGEFISLSHPKKRESKEFKPFELRKTRTTYRKSKNSDSS